MNQEQYLEEVRAALRGMPAGEIEEILLELRGHIAERSATEPDAEAVLRSLGDPAELARQYRTDHVAERAECGGSPLAVLHSLALLRGRRLGRWLVLAVTLFGYVWAIAFGAAAIEKIFSPRDVGLWQDPGREWLLRLRIDGPGPAGSRELLGWWLVPLGLATCVLLLYYTKWFGLWWIRRFRNARTR